MSNELLSNYKGLGQLTEVESKALFKEAGLPVPTSKFCSSVEQAVHSSMQMNLPVVVKMVSKEIIHKSDMGGVILNNQSPEDVRKACERILDSVDHSLIDGFLIEEMVDSGLEFIIGFFKDENFGDMIMFGLGGIFTEILKDFSLRSLPISEYDAMDMINSLKNNKLLNGFRQYPKVDQQVLVQILLKLGGEQGVFTQNSSKLEEVDINPIIYNKDGVFIVDASIVLNNDSRN
ncbi:acetate--CoA ligase family protein [Metabacillus herbersteinensis]|uniref:Acetate--CoA ligase family protein n=1 Tax=Metabacillus herbersteinensis TaxID=283816 RepID=A0ABV6GIG7_9BACI